MIIQEQSETETSTEMKTCCVVWKQLQWICSEIQKVIYFPTSTLQVWQDHSDPSVHPGRFVGWPSRAGGKHYLYSATPYLCHLCGPESGTGACRAFGQLSGLPDPPGECQGKGMFDVLI